MCGLEDLQDNYSHELDLASFKIEMGTRSCLLINITQLIASVVKAPLLLQQLLPSVQIRHQKLLRCMLSQNLYPPPNLQNLLIRLCAVPRCCVAHPLNQPRWHRVSSSFKPASSLKESVCIVFQSVTATSRWTRPQMMGSPYNSPWQSCAAWRIDIG